MNRELQTKLDAVAELYRAKALTDAAFHRFYGYHPEPEPKDPAPEDRDSEDYFRWSLRKDRALNAKVKTDGLCLQACDSLFAWYLERDDIQIEKIANEEAREERAAHGQFGMGA